MTPELARLLEDLREEFAADIARGDIRSLGTFNCRRKNNTATGPWSEHAWPNAVDVMLANNTRRKAVGDRVAAWARRYGAAEVFWQIALHYDHVHITANPRRNYDNRQVPPCAGGKDVDEMELIKNIQTMLNKAGARDYEGKSLVVDGIWGRRTESAFINGLKQGGSGGVSRAEFDAHRHDEGSTGAPL